MSSTASLPSPLAVARLVLAVAALPAARFAGFTYRAKGTGELASHVVILGASYENTLRDSIVLLRDTIRPTLRGVDSLACEELLASLVQSMVCLRNDIQNPDYTKAGLYEAICPGIKAHRVDGSLEIAGLAHSKKVIEEGIYKSVNSSAKTIAKNKLRNALPVGKYRTFALDAGSIESVRISGTEIVF